ncbi:urease accessory protein UreF [Effusibacillus consociatus]|uniref:Urease accessory protein UreF n=1 Tax=Effusibacillus consociatus TaxID=1117041 RepID=A0ABV9PW65_9BACL
MFSLLPLIQLIDSAFPTGVFSHSFGLETALQENRIQNGEELSEWLGSYVTGNLAPMEGAAVFWAHWYADRIIADQPEKEVYRKNLRTLDRRLTLSRLSRESREGGVKIGKRYLRIVLDLYPECGLEEYDNWIRSGESYGNACIVHGWICAHLQQSPENAIASHLYAGVNALIQNALRAMPIGQTEGQKVLKSLLPVIKQEAERIVLAPPAPNRLSSHTIAQEIGAMRHETLYSRLFMS